MKYFIEEETGKEVYSEIFKGRKYSLTQDPEEADIIVAIGGDGAILRAARRYENSMILPVRKEGSKGYKMEIDEHELLESIDTIEEGKYHLERELRVSAYKDGKEIGGDFKALNEVQLHHKFPGSATRFKVEVRDGRKELCFEEKEMIGDGIIISTPFGSTGYSKSVSGKTIDEGIGVAFNNIHLPEDYPDFLHLTEKGSVMLEILEEGSGILAKDNDPEFYEPKTDERIEIRDTGSPVSIVRLGLEKSSK